MNNNVTALRTKYYDDLMAEKKMDRDELEYAEDVLRRVNSVNRVLNESPLASTVAIIAGVDNE